MAPCTPWCVERVFARVRLSFPRTPAEWEIIRRSTVMLSPGQNAALDRETALALLDELGRLSAKDRQVRDLLARLQAVLEAAARRVVGNESAGVIVGDM